MAERIICLDFDGVLCNSIKECALVSHNAYFNASARNLDEIPTEFQDFFFANRHFVRPARHYCVLMTAYDAGIRSLTAAQFQDLQVGLDDAMNAFESAFFTARETLKEDEAHWLSLHETYEQSIGFVRDLDAGFFVVTTKDRDSVLRIATRDGYAQNIRSVYSRETSEDKRDLFILLLQENDINRTDTELIFVDDNSDHLADVAELGITPYFASWGYERQENHFARLNNLDELAS